MAGGLVSRAVPAGQRRGDLGPPQAAADLSDDLCPAAGEQFDLLIYDHEHVLVEFAASVGRTIRARPERKRRLYEEATGVRPTRVILATASIYSRRAEELRKAGIEVIEPEEPLEEFVEESGEPVT